MYLPGQPQSALGSAYRIERSLGGGVSALLRLDPFFASLGGTPEFQRLVVT
jgi:hypothetical protein